MEKICTGLLAIVMLVGACRGQEERGNQHVAMRDVRPLTERELVALLQDTRVDSEAGDAGTWFEIFSSQNRYARFDDGFETRGTYKIIGNEYCAIIPKNKTCARVFVDSFRQYYRLYGNGETILRKFHVTRRG